MRFSLLITVLVLAKTFFAQEIYVELSSDQIAVNERFTYTIVTHKKGKIIEPDFEGFKILRGPDYGESTVNQYVNGQSSTQSTYTYTYTLQGDVAGIYTIDEAKLKWKKKIYKSEAVKIRVDSEADAMAQKVGIADYYLTLEADRESVYMGEAFTVSLKYYSKKRPSSVEGYENGTSSGLWRQDLRDANDPYSIFQESIKGSRYYVIELRKELCIPLSAGTIDIEPSYGSVIFNGSDFFSPQYREDGYSNSLEINVKAIPEDRPENFNGLVGSFELTHGIDRTTVNAGEAIEMNIAIEGIGNLNAFDEPELALPSSFQRRDPELVEDISMTNSGVKGKMEYKFSFTPTEEGTYKILPYHFSYFDLRSKTYKMASTEEFEINVKPSKGGNIIVDKFSGSSTELPSDIRYIHDESDDFFKESDLFFGSFGYAMAVASPLLLAISFVFFKWRQENMSDEEKTVAQQKVAKKSALKELEAAKDLVIVGNDAEALKNLQNSLNSFFMVKLQLSLSDLSQGNIANGLSENKISDATISQFKLVWSNLEMAQFAPMSSENLSTLIDNAQNVIDQINSELE